MRPRFTLRLRLTLLYGGLLAVVAVTLLGTAAVVLDRAVLALPRFPSGQRLQLRDAAGRAFTVSSSDLVRAKATAEILADRYEWGPVTVFPGLRDQFRLGENRHIWILAKCKSYYKHFASGMSHDLERHSATYALRRHRYLPL